MLIHKLSTKGIILSVDSNFAEIYKSNSKLINNEILQLLISVDPEEVRVLIDEIIKADKVFFIGVGRVFLSLQCFCKRLTHLGIEANIVGSVNEKAISTKDLLIVASGSGESVCPAVIAKKASALDGRIGLITSARDSTIKTISNFAVHLPSPTKNDPNLGVKSKQPMSTLFDQALHIFGDVVSMIIQSENDLTEEELWNYHANLE